MAGHADTIHCWRRLAIYQTDLMTLRDTLVSAVTLLSAGELGAVSRHVPDCSFTGAAQSSQRALDANAVVSARNPVPKHITIIYLYSSGLHGLYHSAFLVILVLLQAYMGLQRSE